MEYRCKGCGTKLKQFNNGYCTETCKQQHIRRMRNKYYREMVRKFRSSI